MPLNTGGGAGGNAGGIRAGLAFVELVARDKLGPVLDKLRAKVAGFGAAFTKGGAAGLAAGTAVLAPIVGLAAAGAERFDRMANEAIRLNVPIEQYYRLARAAEIAGVSIDDVANNPRAYAGVLFDGGAVPVREIRAAVEASREWRRTWIALQETAAGLVADLLPVIKAVAAFVRENAGVIAVAAAVGAGLVAAGAAAVGVGVAFSGIAAAVGVLKAALLALLSPVGLVSAAVAGVVTLWATFTDRGRETASELGRAFTEVGGLFSEMWGGIVAAVKSGDLESAFEILAAGVKAIFFTMIAALGKALGDFLKDMHGRIVAVVTVLAGIRGAMAGAAFGPLGILIGGVGLGAAGGLGTDWALDKIEGGLDLVADRFSALARDAAAEMRGLNAAVAARTGPAAAAASLAGIRAITPDMMNRARGVFGGPLGQQLGAGDQWQRRMLSVNERTNEILIAVLHAVENTRDAATVNLVNAVGDAVGGLVFS